jgi:hypothetical protein
MSMRNPMTPLAAVAAGSLPAAHPEYGVPFGAAVFAGDYIAFDRTAMAEGYSELANQTVRTGAGVDYAYRDTGGGREGELPMVLLQHFRGNLDNWDPAPIDGLASTRRVVTFDNAGVSGSSGTTPDTIEQMARDAWRSSPSWDSARSICSASRSEASSRSRSRWSGRPLSAG